MATVIVPPRPGLASPVKMTDENFRSIREYIYQVTGIYFQDNKKYLLEGRLSKRLQALNLTRYDDYLQLLKFGSRRVDELRMFYEAITINETFFFRNEPQFEALENTIIPELMKARASGKTKLRIWSAAASTGEEAYTIAMIYLEKLKPRFPGLDIEVVGTDINHAVLQTARDGVYRDYSVRNMPKAYMDKYLVARDGRYHVKDTLRQFVRFEHLNLYDDARMRQMRNFDVTFCCNVLIYFDLPSKTKVVAHLYDGLNKGGFLFIGYAESLHGISKAFRLMNFPKTVAYRKE